MDDDNLLINLNLSLSIGPPQPRPSPPPFLGRTEGHLDLSLRLFTRPPTSPPPPEPSPPPASTAFTAARIYQPPYTIPFEESRRTEDHLDLSLRLFTPPTSHPPPEPSPPPSSTAARLYPLPYRFPFEEKRITEGDLDLSLRLAGTQLYESSPSHDFAAASTTAIELESSDASNSTLNHPRRQRLPAASHRRRQRIPTASQDFPPTPQYPSSSLSTAESTSPPSPQHPHPRPLLPGRYSLVSALGTNPSSSSKSAPPVLGCVRPPPSPLSEIASSTASFPKRRRRSDSAAMRPCISRSCEAPEAAAAPGDMIDPFRMETPFPWESERPAGVRSLAELRRLNITKVKGRLRCNRCGLRVVKEYDIEEEFNKLAAFVVAKEGNMNDRAPEEWVRPAAQECPNSICGMMTLTVEMPPAEKMEEVNWLFMLLGRTLGQCNLKQLKYFCMHNGNLHRSGAKDRLLYKTYMSLCYQLDPNFRARFNTQEEDGLME